MAIRPTNNKPQRTNTSVRPYRYSIFWGRNMDIRLIRANIALAEDDRLEVLRLLEEFRHASDKTDDHESLMMWLEAHAQTDHNALIRHLEKLLKQTPPYDIYHQMAHDYLWKE